MRIEASALLAGSPDECFAIMSDPDFQEAKIEHTGAIDGSTTVEVVAERTTIHTERAFPTASLPDVVRRLAGGRLVVVETQTWDPRAQDGARIGLVELHVIGQPLILTGRLALLRDPQGARSSVAGDLKARIPLIGGRFEAAAAPIITAGANAEYELLAQWLTH